MLPNVHEYDEVVRLLRAFHRAGFTSAIIAGGAVRDIYCNVIARNVDIFIQDPKHSTEPVQRGLLDVTEPDFDTDRLADLMQLRIPTGRRTSYADDRIKRSSPNWSDGTISARYSAMKNFLPIEVYFTWGDPISYVEDSFDYGICKCYCDGRRIRFTNDFLHDTKHKTLTLVGKTMSGQQYIDAIKDHLPRLQYKFPGYSHAVASWNQPLVAKYVNP